MELCGYRRVRWRTALCYLLCVLALGIPLLIFHWKPRLRILATGRRCSLAEADTLVVKDVFGQIFIVEVQEERGVDPSLQVNHAGQPGAAVGGSVALAVGEEEEFKDTIQLHHKEEANVLRYFVFEGMRYIWRSEAMAFVKVSSLDEGLTCGEVHKSKSGLSQSDRDNRKLIYGPNDIDVPIKSYGQLLIEEVLNPFYLFQVFSVVLWFCEGYDYYAGCIIVISIISITVSLYETRKQSVTLHNMVKMAVSVTVRRATGEELMVNSLDLVPGDCVLLPPGALLMPCDAVLLSGECMVNESMLTGESVPEMKTPLPAGPLSADTAYSSDAHRRHTLFCGTQIIQAKSYVDKEVIAIVVKTDKSLIVHF